MITREDLIGKELGKNQWGNMRYDVGLIETYLPGEFDYHNDHSEGIFLANLCLYLLSGKSDHTPFFPSEEDRLFLEHFIFHNISQKKFQDTISMYSDEKLKVKGILSLINTDIKMEKDIRFHDFYVNGYQSFAYSHEPQAILYCQNLVELFKRSGYPENWAPPQSWQQFCQSCEEHQIPLAENAPPLPNTREALKTLLTNYKEKRTAVVDSDGITKEYFHNKFFAPTQKSFTQKSDAVDDLERALDGENVDLSKHLSTLRNGTLGKNLRAFIKAGHANNLVDKEVTTIREFVAALQAIITPSAQSAGYN
jgi:hypothetical protein